MLSEIDPDKLFETCSVEEVEDVEKMICLEIEAKKEELRTLVGERYRDLIEAADTIKEMKDLSLHIIKDVEIMNREMVNLKNNRQAFKPELYRKDRATHDSLVDSIASQISILVDLPELIWAAITDKIYVKATQLYLLGRHIKTGFTADKSLKQFANRLPVVEQQWSALSHFSNTILRAAEADLKKTDLANEEASMCLASIAILQDTSLVSKFLSLRTDALEMLFVSETTLKNRILDSCHCIINSLSLLYSLILEPWELGKGLVWKQLHNSLANNKNPINLLQDNIKISLLPPVILHFKVKPLSKIDLEMDKLERIVSDWLCSIKQIVSVKGKSLLNQINTLHNLNEITAEHKVSNSNWEQLLVTFNVKEKFNLWDGVYKPLITSRAKELISLQCDETFDSVVKNIHSSISEEDVKRSDLDLRWFVWKEASDDLDIPPNNSTHTKGISLKSKGITPKVYDICSEFEQKLGHLYQDLSGLYSSNDILDCDSNELKNHQQTACSAMILKLIKHIHDLVDKDNINEGNISILARFLQAVPDICPMLQKCLMLGENKDNAWETIKMLNSESLYCWGVWEKKALSRIQKYIPELVKIPASYEDLLNMIPQWEVVWIDEGGEEKDKAKSKLRVPSSPSFPLQAALQQVMTEIGKAHVPKLIAENLMQKVVPILLDCYNPDSQLCQAHSLQSLFDVKYITAQFIPLTNKELNKLCQDKIVKLENSVDPIDLEAFSPYIRANVKSALIKTQGMFGLSFHSEDNAAVKLSDDACILAMSKSCANIWFPLLPITNPTNRLFQANKTKTIKAEKHFQETDTSKIPSSSSFFYEWFS